MKYFKKNLTAYEKDILKEITRNPGITLQDISKIFKPWSLLLLMQFENKNVISVDIDKKINITEKGLELLK